MAQDEEGGYVFRGADGSFYLIRDDVLEAAKVTGEDLEFAKSQEPDVEGFALSAGPFTSFARIEGISSRMRPQVRDTIMCGW